LLDTEAGSSGAGVGGVLASVEVSYAYPVSARTIAAPMLRLTHSKATRDAYAEDDDVSFPVAYDAATNRVKTFTLGADVFRAASARLTLRASAGIEADALRDGSTISGTSAIPGLTDFSFARASPAHTVRV
jgi:uncharacterized protein YhjY with autotransporter beta-barrel domain